MILAKSMAGFMKRDCFYIITISIRPFECIVVIYFAPGHIEFVVIIRVDRIPLIIGENYCKCYSQYECASVWGAIISKKAPGSHPACTTSAMYPSLPPNPNKSLTKPVVSAWSDGILYMPRFEQVTSSQVCMARLMAAELTATGRSSEGRVSSM